MESGIRLILVVAVRERIGFIAFHQGKRLALEVVWAIRRLTEHGICQGWILGVERRLFGSICIGVIPTSHGKSGVEIGTIDTPSVG